MSEKTNAIVLSSIKYQEKDLIVRCYTEQHGLLSYFIRNVFVKSKKNIRFSYFQPLTLLEITGNHKGKGQLEYLSDLRLLHPYQSIHTDFRKNTVAIFVSELLSVSIHEENANAKLFTFLETALLWFDTHDFHPDFHLVLMMELTKYLGFYPQKNTLFHYFDSKEGKFTNTISGEYFNEEQTLLFKKLLNTSFQNDAVFSQSERRMILKLLLLYYNDHIPHLRALKSIEILQDLF